MKNEKINHPNHYAEGRVFEPIDVIRDWDLNFNLGNVVKYISRAGRKDSTIQELQKASVYLNHEINSIKNETDKNTDNNLETLTIRGTDINRNFEDSNYF